MKLEKYIQSKLKIIQDYITILSVYTGIDTKSIPNLLDDDIELEYSNNVINRENITKAEDILTDVDHRYISDKQLEELKNKVGRLEMESALKDLENNMKITLNKQMDNIYNSKDILDSINNLKTFMQENDENKNFLESFGEFVDKKLFNTHTESDFHLTDKDRQALNILLSCISNGFADWNADKTQAGYIKNKPEALPADGGDAHTVGGYSASVLMNKQLDNYILGISGNSYTDEDVNVLIDDLEKTDILEYIKSNTSIALREGVWDFKNTTLKISDTVTLHGVGYGTVIKNCDVYIQSYSNINNLCFENCNVYIISENSDIENVIFKKCKIDINVNCSIIQKCRFIECYIKFDIYCYGSIMTHNIVVKSGNFTFLGGNNIVGNENIIIY